MTRIRSWGALLGTGVLGTALGCLLTAVVMSPTRDSGPADTAVRSRARTDRTANASAWESPTRGHAHHPSVTAKRQEAPESPAAPLVATGGKQAVIESSSPSLGHMAYAALVQRARKLELNAIERQEAKYMAREAAWRETPGDGELRRRAEAVDNEANARLATLARKYDLTEEQQMAIFPVLAVESSAYHPALEIDGDPIASGAATADAAVPPDQNMVDEELHSVLDEQQKQALEDDWVERDQWWSEIVSELEGDLDEDLAAMNDDGGGGQAYEESGNLFGLMK